MKLSVSVYSLNKMISSKEMTIFDVLEFLAGKGVKYIELVDFYIPEDEDKAAVKECMDRLGLKVSSYSISNNFVADADQLQKQRDYVKDSIRWADYFGTKLMRVFCANATDQYTYEQGLEMIVDSFRECTKAAEENGVTYALENHGMFAGKASQVKNILDSVGSPALKSTADTGNFLLVCNDPVEAVSLLIDDIAHVHFKDFKKVESGGYEAQDGTHYIGTAIGDGQVDLKKIVALLREKGYDGFLSIEYEGSDADNLEAVTHSIEFTNSIL